MSYSVEIKELDLAFGAVKVLQGLNLNINQGEFLVLLGSSGCGKSTLLNCIAGLLEVTDGQIFIKDKNVTWAEPSERGIGMVFQSYALYPHMTVRDNMSFALKLAKMPANKIKEAVDRAAKILQLDEYLDRLPKALSGGQRQRVAIGRSIVRDPKVYLFDEPLSNLDAALRVATRIEIAQLKESMPNSTMIYVTHDQVEAMTLASRIVVLDALKDNGYSHSIAQVGTPLELYETPENEFVARFIGSPAMNLLAGEIVETGDQTGVKVFEGSGVTYSNIKTTTADMGLKVNVGIRPEDFVAADVGGDFAFTGSVQIAEALGEVTLLYFETPKSDEDTNAIIAKLPGIHKSMRGKKAHLTANPAKVHLFHNGQSLYYR